jgi:tRNA acetyltransferase TAN1
MIEQFAIRTSIRNNKDFTRDGLIRSVAAAVGPGHKVDLSGYDLLILVEIYKVRKSHVG